VSKLFGTNALELHRFPWGANPNSKLLEKNKLTGANNLFVWVYIYFYFSHFILPAIKTKSARDSVLFFSVFSVHPGRIRKIRMASSQILDPLERNSKILKTCCPISPVHE